MSKPRVLVLGGAGFIGRNLVQYLVEKDLVSKVRVADKVLPALASLSAAQKAIFDNAEKVEFKQCNLAKAATVTRIFDPAEGKFDYVINLAGETKYSQAEAVYQENIIGVSVTCAKEAAKQGVKRFIEVSTAQVYESGSKPRKETAKIKPWTGIAKAKYEAEKQLLAIEGLNLVIVRPAIVYGPGDLTGITPRLVIAAVYKSIKEKMEFLWDKDLRIHTVHVRDVVSALWFLTTHGEHKQIFNLGDESDTSQGSINHFIETIYGIKTGFLGKIQSTLATKVAMKVVADTANDKHLKPWSDLCKNANISTTPLTPYLDEELLYDNDLAVDGSLITTLGFKYSHPKVEESLLRESVDYYLKQGSFPSGIL
jgi:nucleoside-diphosphate-sugar epimerase